MSKSEPLCSRCKKNHPFLQYKVKNTNTNKKETIYLCVECLAKRYEEIENEKQKECEE